MIGRVGQIKATYVPEVPLNHLDLPADKLPQTNADMKNLIDRASRWIKR